MVGLQWMVSLYNNKLNGILADEMVRRGEGGGAAEAQTHPDCTSKRRSRAAGPRRPANPLLSFCFPGPGQDGAGAGAGWLPDAVQEQLWPAPHHRAQRRHVQLEGRDPPGGWGRRVWCARVCVCGGGGCGSACVYSFVASRLHLTPPLVPRPPPSGCPASSWCTTRAPRASAACSSTRCGRGAPRTASTPLARPHLCTPLHPSAPTLTAPCRCTPCPPRPPTPRRRSRRCSSTCC